MQYDGRKLRVISSLRGGVPGGCMLEHFSFLVPFKNGGGCLFTQQWVEICFDCILLDLTALFRRCF